MLKARFFVGGRERVRFKNVKNDDTEFCQNMIHNCTALLLYQFALTIHLPSREKDGLRENVSLRICLGAMETISCDRMIGLQQRSLLVPMDKMDISSMERRLFSSVKNIIGNK